MTSARVNREDLLRQLESISPGLSPKEIVDQSSCFILNRGFAITYNEEIACRQKTKLPFKGAVQALPLLSILNKLAEDELTIEQTESELLVKGKNRKAGISMQQEIVLPVDEIDEPGKWHPVPSGFSDALSIVEQCASNDASSFSICCVHIHPKWLEACDNFQFSRVAVSLGNKKSILVRRTAIRHAVSLAFKDVSETDEWLHFRNESGLTMSFRKYVEDYPQLSKLIKMKGTLTSFPKGLGEAAEKAEIFSSENSDENQVLVELRPERLRIKGHGVSGWYSEVKRLNYKGPPMSFRIAPKLLKEITEKYNQCEITTDRLKVSGDGFCFIASLGVDNG